LSKKLARKPAKKSSSEPPSLNMVDEETGNTTMDEKHIPGLMQATGQNSRDNAAAIMNQLLNAYKGDDSLSRLNLDLALLHDIKPRDSLETMLACQMIAVHNTAMDMSGRATTKGQTVDAVERGINRMTKLMRTFTAQMECLQKYRNGGKQSIKVEHQHVNVNDGGQAIVGDIHNNGGGE
jgi:hypothetical protein